MEEAMLEGATLVVETPAVGTPGVAMLVVGTQAEAMLVVGKLAEDLQIGLMSKQELATALPRDIHVMGSEGGSILFGSHFETEQHF